MYPVSALFFGCTISTWSLKRQLSHLHLVPSVTQRPQMCQVQGSGGGGGSGWGEVGVTVGFRWMNRSHGAFKCRLKFCNYETSARDRTAVIAESESWNS